MLDLLPLSARAGALWTQRQRSRYRRSGRCLTPAETDGLAAVFPATTLAAMRIASAPPLDGSLAGKLFLSGIPPQLMLSLLRANGITFVDTILMKSPGSPGLSLLFHEAVHVLQFQELGVEGFIRCPRLSF